MNAPNTIKETIAMPVVLGDGSIQVKRIFRWINRAIIAGALCFFAYFLFASDRYVSDATILVQNTDFVASSGLDFSALMAGRQNAVSIPDQLLLKEHLMSMDMLKKLDGKLDLRSHFSNPDQDIASRMWLKDVSVEWFHRHFLNRVTIDYDEFAGVLRISSQAYSPEMAHAITAGLVAEGEKYMNEMTHALARAQVRFLETQVEHAQDQVKDARDELEAFQNRKGIISPKATVEAIRAVISKLEGQRTQLQTQLAALPRELDRNHSARKSLQQSLGAVEQQIAAEEAKLASSSGAPLNALIGEEARLTEEVALKQEVYKNALICLEKGRMDAARTLKMVAVLQAPTMPEYAWQPRRIYGCIATVCVALIFLGIANLLKSVVLDHVD